MIIFIYFIFSIIHVASGLVLPEFVTAECAKNPCQNGGTFYQNDTFISCMCLRTFTGDHCQDLISECKINPCYNGGTFTITDADSKCSCTQDYTGPYCLKQSEKCQPNPCMNKGVCSQVDGKIACMCNAGFIGEHCEKENHHDCGSVELSPGTKGIFNVTLKDSKITLPVLCECLADGRKALIFQRRMDGSEDFYRTFEEYRKGFGNLTGEFWLGNDNLNQITNQYQYTLCVDLEDFDNAERFAEYSTFSIGNLDSSYTLTIGGYSGVAGDSFGSHNSFKFSTFDHDLDTDVSNCAELYHGAWWYSACHTSNLNGLYLRGVTTSYANGVAWYHFKGHYYSLKISEMKIIRK